jgi:ABC-type phosphate transport system substrate-binding protein
MKIRLLGLVLMYTLLTGASVRQAEVHVVVVVNTANPTRAIQRDRLARIFLREVETWDDGREILPVDQIDKSPAHAAFARDVLGRSVIALKRYWQERIFSGNESPPPDRVNDGDVLTYVRSNPGAIGYVLEGQELGAGVKALPILSTTKDATSGR